MKSKRTPYDAFESKTAAKSAAKEYNQRCKGAATVRKIKNPGRLKYEVWVKDSCVRYL